MDTEGGHLGELAGNLPHTEGTYSYNRRVVEHQDHGGTTRLMLGVGEFWLCDNKNRAYMSGEHNAYICIPILMWRQFIKNGWNAKRTSYPALHLAHGVTPYTTSRVCSESDAQDSIDAG